MHDVNDVRLLFRSAERNTRWQLVVTRRGGPPLYSDSITCGRGLKADVSDTRAGRAFNSSAARSASPSSGVTPG